MHIRLIARARRLRALALGICIAAAVALPTAAAGMPIDNGPKTTQAPGHPVAPEIRTVVESSDATWAIVIAGAALLVAMASACYSTLRLASQRRVVHRAGG
jgi:hypothetical protein